MGERIGIYIAQNYTVYSYLDNPCKMNLKLLGEFIINKALTSWLNQQEILQLLTQHEELGLELNNGNDFGIYDGALYIVKSESHAQVS